jgi:hypothetical protein
LIGLSALLCEDLSFPKTKRAGSEDLLFSPKEESRSEKKHYVFRLAGICLDSDQVIDYKTKRNILYIQGIRFFTKIKRRKYKKSDSVEYNGL